MKILVTGGAGFIGANFIYALLRDHAEDELVCLDKLTYAGNIETLKSAMEQPAFRFYRADICDREAVMRIFATERPDAVVNFAAESHVDRSICDPALFLKTNLCGTQVLLDACLSCGVPRFHQVSTDEVYGDLPLEGGAPFTESSPLRASSPYSASKAGADLLVGAYHRTYGLHTTVSRCSNNFGPCQFPEKLIPLAIIHALRGEEIPVYGQGENVRDWLFVEDHCRAIDLILRGGAAGEIYNLGGNCQRDNLSVVRDILALTGGEPSLIRFVADRKGHDLRYAVDFSKAETALGWRPSTPFAEGLARTVDWYLAHRGWWERILSGDYLNSAREV